jgi:hypothetical protein
MRIGEQKLVSRHKSLFAKRDVHSRAMLVAKLRVM